MRYAPVLPVVLPLFTAALLGALTKLIPQWLSLVIGLLGAFCTTLASGFLLYATRTETMVYWFGNWGPVHGKTLGICFAIDPLGAGLACFAGFLTCAALIFSTQYFDNAGNHFHALILAFLAGMSGFTLTGDLFNLFVFFELMSAAAFALCAYKTEDPSSLQGSFNFAVTNTIGAYFILTAIGLLYARTGALNIAQIGQTLALHSPDRLVLTAFALIVCGYFIKAAVVPFHFWLADAHAVAPTPICVLFSGVMVQMGLYAVARMYWAGFETTLHSFEPQLRLLFVSVGVATAVIGGVMCYSQRNLKRLLAFSTISHMGLMTSGVALFTAAGLAGTALYTLGHGCVKAALFLCAGILLHRFESVDEMELHGKGKAAKWAALAFFPAAIGLAGVTPSGVAAGDDLIRRSAAALGYDWLKWISWFASGITVAAVLRAGGRIFFGFGPARADEPGGAPKQEEKPETERGHQSTPLWMWFPALVLAIAGLLIGAVPDLARSAVAAAARFENTAGYAASVFGAAKGASLPAGPAQLGGDSMTGLLVLLTAAATAAADLFSKPFRTLARTIVSPLTLLHKLHSGHVGDYVAFLTFGIGAFALCCLFLLR